MFPLSLSLAAKSWACDTGTPADVPAPGLELGMGDTEEGMVKKALWRGGGSRGRDADDTAGAEGQWC